MYSLDFRQRVFSSKEKNNLTFEQTSKKFGVSMRTLFAWQQRIEPITKRNKPATKIDMELLKKDIAESPDTYQWERATKFKVAQSTVFYALQRLGISYKKNSVSSQSRRSTKKRI